MLDFKKFAELFIANDNWFGYMEHRSDLEKAFELIEAFDFYKLYDKSGFDFDQFCEDYWHQPA